MGKDRAPASQFYWRDWIVDTRGMTRDQRGGYIDVLAFTNVESSRPGVMTEEQVRTWAGYSEDEWPAHRDVFRARFRIRRDGMWIQKRVIEERRAQKTRYKRAQKGADVTNAARWGSVAERQTSDPPSDEQATRKRSLSGRPTRGPIAPASASASASAGKATAKTGRAVVTDSDAGGPDAGNSGTAGSLSRGDGNIPASGTVRSMSPSPISSVLAGVMHDCGVAGALPAPANGPTQPHLSREEQIEAARKLQADYERRQKPGEPELP
ncbi:MAG TPA: hypothetical protein VJY35_08920 [Candidatus Eisenbacteria bacterium]|nr:hypothetical protein [Candidatus Eisenbacteria bacterium]